MPHVYELKDGSVRTIFDMHDAMEIVEETAGHEIRQYLEETIRDYELEAEEYEEQFKDWERDRDGQSDDRHALLCDIRDELDVVISLLGAERLSRKKLLDCVSRLRQRVNSEL